MTKNPERKEPLTEQALMSKLTYYDCICTCDLRLTFEQTVIDNAVMTPYSK